MRNFFSGAQRPTSVAIVAAGLIGIAGVAMGQPKPPVPPTVQPVPPPAGQAPVRPVGPIPPGQRNPADPATWKTGLAKDYVSGRPARGSVMDGAGPTIANGMVYVTSGYQGRSGTAGQVLMAFSIDGK